MKWLQRTINDQRVVIYFIIAIVIPSILMGFLAFRGVLNDQALLEQSNRKQAFEIGERIFQSTSDILNNIKDSLFSERVPVVVDGNTYFKDSSLSAILNYHPYIVGVVYSDKEVVQILSSKVIYSDFNEFREDSQTSSLDKRIEHGWKIEHQLKDFENSLNYYQNLYSSLDDQNLKAIVKISIARLFKKTGQWNEAIEAYIQLGNIYENICLNQSIPLGLISNLELSNLYFESGDTIKAIKSLEKLYQDLLQKKWEINKGTYSFLKLKSSNIINPKTFNSINFSSEMEALASIVDELDKKEQYTNVQLEVQKQLKNNSNSELSNPGHLDHSLETIGGDNYIVCKQIASGKGMWFFILDPQIFLMQELNTVLKRLSNESRWEWLILNETGKVLLGSKINHDKSDQLKINFTGALSNYSLLAIKKPASWLRTFLKSGKGIYLYMFIFIGLILIFGILFILHSVKRELHLNKLKSNFIDTVSHEFKSPLTAINQRAEMLFNERVTEKKKSVYYSIIMQQGAILSHLIDNILDFSIIERGIKTYEFRKSDIGNVVEDSVQKFRTRVKDLGFTINFEKKISAKVHLDISSIQQVVYNLLDNAMKYSGNSKIINVSQVQKDNQVITSIRDYGIGIAEEEKNRIFERFYRVNNSETQRVKGSGIGLALVREIINSHGGELYVESKFGKGSIFYFSIPKTHTKT